MYRSILDGLDDIGLHRLNRSEGQELVQGEEPDSSYRLGDVEIDLFDVGEPSLVEYLLPGRRSGEVVGKVGVDQQFDEMDLYVESSSELKEVERALASFPETAFSYE